MPPGARWEFRARLDEVLGEADIVSLHVPLTPETRHLIGARELALMRPGSYLVNTARGPVVDEAALVEALRSGHLGGAGLDVYEREPELAPGLADLPNVTLLPHLGSATVETRGRMAELAALNAIAAVRGEPVPHPVNPEVLPALVRRCEPDEAPAARSPRPARRAIVCGCLLLGAARRRLAAWSVACSSGGGQATDTSVTTGSGSAPSGDIEATVGEVIKVGNVVDHRAGPRSRPSTR